MESCPRKIDDIQLLASYFNERQLSSWMKTTVSGEIEEAGVRNSPAGEVELTELRGETYESYH